MLVVPSIKGVVLLEKPHQPEVERAVLAACLADPDDYFDACLHIRDAKEFFIPAHQSIWAAMGDVFAKSGHITVLDVQAQLRLTGLHELAADALGAVVATTGGVDIEHAAAIVHSAYRLRKAAAVGSQIASRALEYPEDINQFMDWAEGLLFTLGEESEADSILSAPQASLVGVEHLERLVTLGGALVGAPSGFLELDSLSNGFQAGQLITLAARPGMGKTACALNVGITAAAAGHQTLFFSLEMSHAEPLMRAFSYLALVDGARFKDGRLTVEEWDRLEAAAVYYSKLPLWLDDGNTGLDAIAAKARRHKARHGSVGLIVIDYLQIMPDVDGNNENGSLSKITRRLKMLAKELECPVLLLSQLNRNLESRPNKRPMLSDLRGSGAIEQDSNMVLFLYRDSYYNAYDPNDPDAVDMRGIAELIVAKNRSGPARVVELAFIAPLSTFANLEAI